MTSQTPPAPAHSLRGPSGVPRPSPSAGTILVVEDEAPIASAVAARLRSEGYEVEIALDGPDALKAAERVRPDLVVLDLMLPGMDGLDVCRRMRDSRDVAVLMLTARDSESEMLTGFGTGADDYMTKPFSPRELVARVRALLRRTGRGAENKVTAGTIELDPRRRRATVGGEQVHLTPTEFELAYFMASRPGVVHSRQRLLAHIWGYGDGGSTRTIDSHVRALRRKLGADAIRTVHGVGYAFEEPA